MKVLITLALSFWLAFPVFAGDQWSDYTNEQVPDSFTYPAWMDGPAFIFLKLLVAGFVWASIMGKDCKLSSPRGIWGILAGVFVFILSIIFDQLFQNIVQLGIKGIAIILGGIILLAFAVNLFSSKS